jgi:GT2 family glycosyltransferase
MKDISIIIVNYKSGKRLVKCLESLQRIEDSRFSFEVIVVDNHSNDGSQSPLKSLFPQFTFVTNTGNNGFANGCNLGATYGRGTNLLFLNPDTTVNSDALFDMLEEIRVRPEYSIVTCSQVRENGSFERPYGKFLTLFTLTGWLRFVNKIFTGSIEKSVVQSKHYIYPDWVSGSVIMIRRASFVRLGKWDDDFWMYYEDVDLCLRARKSGGEIVKLKNAVVGHVHGGSSRINKEITAITKSEVHISRHLFIAKHETRVSAFFMHFLLIFNNLLLGLLPALLGLVFFFVKQINVQTHLYIRLVTYYFDVLRSGVWLSKRSVNYTAREEALVHRTLYPEYRRAR